ncbi:HxlR family transcriptional regulator [Prauserella marina]|uniref:DNA-binding transcriptional regulator, HxlR family n=1 Tax=Prauserella marina TaxID=530584 RepID=A0A222VW93_9PSEU|nr:helix-turn-helix domain-containing protein [Prauserella marina]ASR37991.1 HxlR family transcriptional regulator [Prauserella marina]PWV73218.1 HxlR family transcriptional regulator [Prauserella marina]SDD69034.1 DNA-binding transcriptional regulator, HxlR family [Prauserella marina]
MSDGFDPELVPDARGATRRPEPECPVEVALAAISGRWTTLVLRELTAGPRSFGELRAALPTVSAKVLTDRLAELTRRGLVGKEVHAGFPTRTSYQLTTAGKRLRPLLVELYRTGAALLAETT